jgi:secretion/DNA translocation related TadE-like protein
VSDHRPDAGRGSAAVLAVTVVGILLVATVLAGALGSAVVDQRRVEAAADLASLAAASAARAGREPCATADDVARRNGARITSCVVQDADVTVTAVRRTRLWTLALLGRGLTVRATSRAGPADGPSP